MDLDEQKNILDVFRQIIEMSQRRGCWMATEMEHIGTTYNKVKTIIEGIEEYQKNQNEQNQKNEANEEIQS